MALLNSTGKRIRALRHDAGLTQAQLADQAGISRPHMSAVEADRVPRVSADVLTRIAEALHTSTDYLLTGRAADPASPSEDSGPAPSNASADFHLLCQRIEGLPPAVREEAIAFLLREVERMESLLQAGRFLGEWEQWMKGD